jgi:hypothetical protein
MTDLVFHKSEQHIAEDLEYYFSGERDIHSQVKPGQDIYSFTPDSEHLNIDFNDKKIGNLFFPFAPGSLDRIYIGISFPLFANNWGAAFLRHLMTLVKADGCVVLPVYPEMQASEKNYWARSILEDIFISRSRWKGMSNIWAENDGVMSMRIGRKPPPEIDSTANYLLRQGSQAVTRHALQETKELASTQDPFLSLHTAHWENVTNSAIIEKIIQDHFGRKKAINLATLGSDKNNGLLAIESLLSPYINIDKAYAETATTTPKLQQPDDVAAYYNHKIKDKLVINANRDALLSAAGPLQVITLINNIAADLIKATWQLLSPGGLLIVHQNKHSQSPKLNPEQIESLLSTLGTTRYYSSIAASEHKATVDISHYSLIIEQELRDENNHKEGVFWVVQK